MTLTKDERFTAYCIMLAEFELDEGYRNHGLCYLACETADTDVRIEHIMLELFPEIRNRKPGKTFNEAYWFRPNNWNARIKLLKQCIIETHP